jgi:hypothetical protein
MRFGKSEAAEIKRSISAGIIVIAITGLLLGKLSLGQAGAASVIGVAFGALGILI